MAQNQYMRTLPMFDPKKDLIVDEKFGSEIFGTESDPLADLEDAATAKAGSAEIKPEAFLSFKTSAPITAGFVLLRGPSKRNYFLISNRQGRVYLFEQKGEDFIPQWNIHLNGSIIRTPAVYDNVAYFTTREGRIFALHIDLTVPKNEDGKVPKPRILWKTTLSKGILSQPAANGKLLFISALNGLYSYEAWFRNTEQQAIGKKLWQHPLSGVVSSPAVDGGFVFLGTEEKKIYAFEFGGDSVNVKFSFEANGEIRSTPYVSEINNYVIFGCIDGSVYCLDKYKGIQRWYIFADAAVYSDIISEVREGKEYFYFGSDSGHFHCIDSFGKKIFSFRTGGKIRTRAAIQDGVVYFGSGDNHFYALDARTGRLIYRYATAGDIVTPPVIEQNMVFFGSTDSFVHGLNTAN